MRLRLGPSAIVVVVLAVVFSAACAPSGFQDPSLIESVRILATSADQPYAKPGATVNLAVLAYDGRANKPEPMTVYWLAVPGSPAPGCVNPPGDAYYQCFGQAATQKVFGAAAALGSGFDISSYLVQGSQYSFTMPADAITSHESQPGTVPYGLVVVFNFACAGHVEILPVDPNNTNPQTVPIGCFDKKGNQLGPDDYVLGYTRVYAYETLTNANPVIDDIDFGGHPLAVMTDPASGQPPVLPPSGPLVAQSGSVITVCPASGCQAVKIGPVVPASSQEIEPQQTDVNGHPLKETIWVDYYVTAGSVDDTKLLYDATSGLVGDLGETDGSYKTPSTSQQVTFWAVVHDDRGGASWVTVPINIQ